MEIVNNNNWATNNRLKKYCKRIFKMDNIKRWQSYLRYKLPARDNLKLEE